MKNILNTLLAFLASLFLFINFSFAQQTLAPTQNVKVALLIINPQIPANNNQNFVQSFNWGNPITLTNDTHASLETASEGVVDFTVTETHYSTSLFTKKNDGTDLTVNELYNQISTMTSAQIEALNHSFDYLGMLNAYDFCTKVDDGTIDEVWIYAMPFLGLWESVMTGQGAFWINGPQFSSSCVEKLSIMGLNYERGVAEALHSFGHRSENVMREFYGGWNPISCGGNHNFNDYTKYDKICPGEAEIGNIHFPPNGIADYDYSNTNYVPSNAYNWADYPDVGSSTQSMNCSEWNCTQRGYMEWWYDKLPKFDCLNPDDGKLNNWWHYIADYDDAVAHEANLAAQGCGTTSGPCPSSINGYTLLGEFEGSKYFISNGTANWSTSETNAQNNGGHLATITSQAENDFILNNINDIVFIGLNDEQNEGSLDWSSGTPYSFTKLTETNTASKDYGKMNFWNGNWGLDGQYTSRKSIVEIPCGSSGNGITITSCPSSIFETAPHGGNYEVYIDWDLPTATTDCAAGGLTLTQITGGTPGFMSPITPVLDGIFVQYQFTDACGNTAECTFSFKVVPAPTEITCPNDITVSATSSSGAVVNYAAPTLATYCTPGPLQVFSGLPSGSEFPIGTTTVQLSYFLNGPAFICQTNAVCSFDVTVTPQGGGGCPNDITGFTTLGEYGDSKYYISNGVAKPVDAQAVAASHGGYLAVIRSQGENNFIQQNITVMPYIGLNDAESEGNLEWVNGESLIYNNVDPCGFCEENSDSKDYVIIAPWNGTWSFSSQWNSRPYVMEIPCSGSSNEVEVTYNCPSDFPQEGNWNIPLTISNNTNSNEPSQEVYLYRLTNNLVGMSSNLVEQITVPSLSSGQSINVNMVADLSIIQGYHVGINYANGGNTNYSSVNGFYLSKTPLNISYEPFDPSTSSLIPIDIFCKKYDTDLSVEIINPVPTYTSDNEIIYTVEVTNNGSETAYNIFSNTLTYGTTIGPPSSEFVTVTDISKGSFATVGWSAIYWFIDELAVGESATISLVYDLGWPNPNPNDPTLPNEYTVDVNVNSFNLGQDGNLNNNEDSFTFEKPNSQGGCPTNLNGFTSLGDFNGSAYFLSNDASRPTDAQNTASSNGGNLAIINSMTENDFIFNQINELVYIGLNDAATEGTPAWVNGDPTNFTNFDICSFCEENSSSKDYVVMHGWNGGWSWSSVWNQRRYIVEIPCTAPLTNSGIGNTLLSFPNNESDVLTLGTLLPNPAMDFIHVSIESGMDQATEIQIFDARGMVVKTKQINVHQGSNTVELMISNLPAGFYNLYLPQAKGTNVMKKFIKVRD